MADGAAVIPIDPVRRGLRICKCGLYPRLVEFTAFQGFAVECECGEKGERFGAFKIPGGVDDPQLWRDAAIENWNDQQ